MTNSKNKILAIILAVMLIVSVLSISAFAEDEDVQAPEATETTTAATESTTSTTATGEGTEENPEKDPVVNPTTEKSWFEKNSELVITLGVIVLIALVVVILFLASPKFREKFKKFWKDYNSEFKKLVWPTKEQLIKNSAVVLLSIVVIGAVLALLDFGFSKGMYALKDLVEFIMPAK